MIPKILNGKKISKKIFNNIKNQVNQIHKLKKRPPGLAVIQIGNSISSKIYVKKKKIACKKIGFQFQIWNFEDSVKEHIIITLINKLNNNKNIDGILIQFPLPKTINESIIIESIHPNKDIDGFHPYNIGCLCQKKPKLRPCTPKGIITLLKKYQINIKGLNAIIIGASNIVGRPMGLELLLSGCTVTIAHRFTKNLNEHIKNSDLIIIAIGKPNFLDGKNIKKGAIIIDVGINKICNKIIGDVNFKSVYHQASYITPVPGGIGPMTVSTLLHNTLESYYKKHYYN